jgi:hypothetical protein
MPALFAASSHQLTYVNSNYIFISHGICNLNRNCIANYVIFKTHQLHTGLPAQYMPTKLRNRSTRLTRPPPTRSTGCLASPEELEVWRLM